MNDKNNIAAESHREPVLNPVDRVSEMLFGLYMALTFVGAVSVADSGRTEVRELLAAALGCNLAWGLVDAVMYLVRTITDRGRSLTLVRSVRAATDTETARALIKGSLSKPLAGVMTDTEIESIRQRVVALPSPPERPKLKSEDLLAALAVFLLVVAATFPVAIPFLIIDDIGLAKTLSRAIALVMLFFGGLALGRYAGYGSWKTGLMMAGLGAAVVTAVIALGG
jgi:VIT1/CCC1 family predicted Fe2+/Mn2+ transporter